MNTGGTRRAAALIAGTLVASWLGMQWVHEAGRVLAAQLTGGKVHRVVLHPLGFSRTDLAENPRPLETAWGGPLFGAVAPAALWGLAEGLRAPVDLRALLRFFTGFCLLANGAYLGLGSFDRVGDCGELLQHGAAFGQLWTFGVVGAACGLLLWHGLGPRFGLGAAAEEVSLRAAYLASAVAAVLFVAGLFLGEE